MRPGIIVTAMLVVTLLGRTTVILAEEENDWLKKHAVVRNHETQDRDDDGNIKAVATVKETTIYIKQINVEIKKRDASGNLVVTCRTNDTVDIQGGKATIVENLLPGYGDLVVTSITTVQKTPDGTVTTIQSRGKDGNMRIINRTTTVTKSDGTISTVVETPDKAGRLIPRQVTNQS